MDRKIRNVLKSFPDLQSSLRTVAALAEELAPPLSSAKSTESVEMTNSVVALPPNFPRSYLNCFEADFCKLQAHTANSQLQPESHQNVAVEI